MKQILEESGMRIPYHPELCYMIEKSAVVGRLKGVKIVEFVEANGIDQIIMLEAKTSAPQPGNKNDYVEYLSSVREKFQNSISLLNAAKLKRLPKIYDELPQALKDIDYKNAEYKLYFIIKQSKSEWIIPLSDDLYLQLRPFLKCWNIPKNNFIVVNEEMARTCRIIE
ncbi:MAG: hypothetical protein IKW86_09935 [Salinivirgaceae bacterium]|nr:hypothetical protein [Salinivirgaceae bacterium]